MQNTIKLTLQYQSIIVRLRPLILSLIYLDALFSNYDRLFDQGYITFSDDGELICGTQLSSYTWDKLSINPTAKNKMKIFPESREYYLEYHRKHVFQDDINDLI